MLMLNVNRIVLVGWLGSDPITRTTKRKGDAPEQVMFEVITERDGRSGRKEEFDYHHVVCSGPLATVCHAHLKSGRGVYVEGRLRTRQCQIDGQRCYVAEVHADTVAATLWLREDVKDPRFLHGPATRSRRRERS